MAFSSYYTFCCLFALWTVLQPDAVKASRGRIVAFFQESCASAVKNPCEQKCVDIKSGGFYCQCLQGYTINPDGMTCTGVWQSEERDSPPADGGDTSGHNDDDNESSVPYTFPVVTETGSNLNAKTRYNSDGEVMVSNSEAVQVKSIDLTRGLPPLQAETRHSSAVVLDSRRGWLESSQVDIRGIPGQGSDRKYTKEDSYRLDIAEGGEYDSNSELDNAGAGEKDKGKEAPTCEGVVCHNNGTCAIVESKTICLCSLGHFGDTCEREVEVRYPRFLGTGYLALPVLRDAHKEFTVSLEFKPESPNGLLLFSGEFSNARTDFFSVVLDDGYIVLRFDCGTGMAELRTLNRVQIAEWNTVVLTRVDNRATVRLNGGHQVEGVSQGNFSRITFRLNLYLGGYTDMSIIQSRVGTRHQFVGCIQELRINDHHFDLRPSGPVGEAEFGVNVGECSEGVCQQVQCLNGGECVAGSADRHVCLCPLGYHGNSCEKDSPVHIPHFSGHSYLELPGLERSVLSYTEIEVVFKPTSHEGTILYNGYSRDRRGDFISLALEDGHIVFRFDLGTGPAEIRSLDAVSPNMWHLVRASRTGLLGSMKVDDQPSVSGQSQGAYTQLTLLDNLYLGGHPNYDHTSRHAAASQSFTGCLQKVVINKQTLKMLDRSVTGINVGPCSHPCAGRPCMNNGQCKPRLDSYACHCPLGFSNTNCEDVQEHAPTKPMFNGESYLMYRDKEITKRVSGRSMDLQIYIRPHAHDGLIFWSGEDQPFSRSSSSSLSSKQDFIALGFHGGSLQLRYNLGSGEALISSNDSRLFDGDWHYIHVQRDKQDAYLEIDKREIVEGSSPGEYTSLNTNKIVYLGGMPDVTDATGGRFVSSFVGCVRSMKLATDYDVKLLAKSYTGVNIEQCRKKIVT